MPFSRLVCCLDKSIGFLKSGNATFPRRTLEMVPKSQTISQSTYDQAIVLILFFDSFHRFKEKNSVAPGGIFLSIVSSCWGCLSNFTVPLFRFCSPGFVSTGRVSNLFVASRSSNSPNTSPKFLLVPNAAYRKVISSLVSPPPDISFHAAVSSLWAAHDDARMLEHLSIFEN